MVMNGKQLLFQPGSEPQSCKKLAWGATILVTLDGKLEVSLFRGGCLEYRGLRFFLGDRLEFNIG